MGCGCGWRSTLTLLMPSPATRSPRRFCTKDLSMTWPRGSPSLPRVASSRSLRLRTEGSAKILTSFATRSAPWNRHLPKARVLPCEGRTQRLISGSACSSVFAVSGSFVPLFLSFKSLFVPSFLCSAFLRCAQPQSVCKWAAFCF
jgi:hypothetical protein